MDLTVNINDYKLNIRVAGLIIHDNKLLVHKNITKSHYGLIGGRIQVGESSDIAIKREIKEELGKEVEILSFLTTVENFYQINGTNYHEFLLIYSLEFTNPEDKILTTPLKNQEGTSNLSYQWIDIDKFQSSYCIEPKGISSLLSKKLPNHVINK